MYSMYCGRFLDWTWIQFWFDSQISDQTHVLVAFNLHYMILILLDGCYDVNGVTETRGNVKYTYIWYPCWYGALFNVAFNKGCGRRYQSNLDEQQYVHNAQRIDVIWDGNGFIQYLGRYLFGCQTLIVKMFWYWSVTIRRILVDFIQIPIVLTLRKCISFCRANKSSF